MLRCSIALCLICALLVGTLPVRAQDPGQPLVHVVQPGENLYRIALNYGVTVEALMAANGLFVPDLVIVGQALIIPVATSPTGPDGPATSPATRVTDSGAPSITHIVQPGESLLTIARQYGITLDAMVAANTVINPSLIVVGQVLVIPSVPRLNGQNAVPAEPTESASSIEPESIVPVPTSEPSIVPDDNTDNPALDPALITPDLGILPAANATDHPQSAPALVTRDLGIIPPGGATWIVQPGILTLSEANARAIYERGQALGNNPHAFSKVGDCNSDLPFFLAKFDKGEYTLGDYAYLQPVIDQFAGSFARQSAAVWTGNHAWALFDPVWANPAICQPGETPLACEYRVHRPSLALIRLGTNEAGSTTLFETNLRQIIEFSIERGVIPVLGTKADRIEGSDAHNELIRRLAAEYQVPLWDFGKVADTLPGRGLTPDGFHLTYMPPDYTAPGALQTGHSVQNLLALMALYTVWRYTM